LFEKELRGKQDEIRQFQNERSEKRTTLNGIENALIRLNTRREELQIQIESLIQSIENLKKTFTGTESGLVTIRNEYTVSETNTKQAELELNSVTLKQTEIRQAVTNLEKQRSLLLTERSKAETESSRCSAQLEVLENADRSLAGLNQGAQFLVKISKQGRLKQNLRSLGSQFIVPKKYEIAAASALGEYLDAVLLDQGDWQFTMDLLCSGNNGRAVLISEKFNSPAPLDKKNASLKDTLSLADFIACKDEIRPLAERLFRNIFLAESREQALELQPSLFPDQTLVTLSGDTFRSNGSVISGNETKFQVLSRSREKMELREKITAASKSAGEITSQLQELEVTVSLNRKLDDRTTAEITQNRANLDTFRKKTSQLAIEIQKQEQTIAFLNQRIRESEKQMQDAANAINQDQSETTKLEGERIALQEALRELSASIHRIQLDELQNQVHHWTLEWTVAEKTIREVQARLSDLNTRIFKDQQKSQQNIERIAGIRRQVEVMNEQKAALQKESADVLILVESIETEITPEEIILSNLETELNTAQTEDQTFRLKVSAAEKALTQTQLDLARMNDNLDILKGKIEDDFGLVAFDYSAQIPGQTPLPLGDMVDELPKIEEIPAELDEQISRQKSLLYRMGSINPESISEYQTVRERFLFLKTQKIDLEKADSDLRKVIDELDGMMKNAFQDTFEKVQIEFKTMFTRLFGGGSAKLILTDPDNLNQSGIDIEAKLPGHREQELSLLSGGERSLTSVALVFALLRVSPTPFCVLDEVDAALDEANVGRFCELLKELGDETQFIVITHNRNTVETADIIYGITMGRDSASQSVSLRLDEVSKDVLN
jgi:chromosome segregation protein